MIISRITGGLGNQLFQYAAARALAVHHNVELKLDISDFNEGRLRSFDLLKFHTKVEIAQHEDIVRYTDRSLLSKVIQRTLAPHKRLPFKEPHFHFYKDFFKAPADCYLKGNWQSE